jgi:hypothetical protein
MTYDETTLAVLGTLTLGPNSWDGLRKVLKASDLELSTALVRLVDDKRVQMIDLDRYQLAMQRKGTE